MSDKLRTGFVIPVSFAEGEQPTNRKFNSIATQSRTGLGLLERAVGDLWNQSGDSTASNFPNRITNLARAIGDQSLLNAQLPLPDFTGTTSVRIKQPIANFLGKSEIILDFIPVVDSVLTSSVNALKNDNNVVYSGSTVATIDLVDSDTEWFANVDKNVIHLGRALHLTQTVDYIEYSVLASNFPSDSYSSSSFSMIPHSSQDDWNGLKISQISANKYYLVLPFRRPGTDITGNSKLPTGSNNIANIASPSEIRYWGPEESGYSFTSGVSDSRFYRYSLSTILLELLNTPVDGTLLPSGTIYLWDNTTETIIEGTTFRVPDTAMTLFGTQVPWVIQIEGATLDSLFNGLDSSDSTESSSDYQSRFSLILTGNSLSEGIFSIRKEMLEGSYSVGIKNKISHSDLINSQPATSDRHEFNFPNSFIADDDHVYLLSRVGSKSSTADQRDRFNNGMMGDLFLLSSSSTNNYQNVSSDSNSVRFGMMTSSGISMKLDTGGGQPIHNGVAHDRVLQVNGGPVQASAFIIGTNGGLAPNDTDEPTNYKFFDFEGFIDQSTVSAGTFYSIGTNAPIASTSGSGEALDTRGAYSSNQIDFKSGGDPVAEYTISGITYFESGIGVLEITERRFQFGSNDLALNGIGSSNVIVGSTNANTHLQLKNNRLEFSSGSTDTLKYDDTTNTYTFRADGTNDAAIDAAIVDAGNLPKAWGFISTTNSAGAQTVTAGLNVTSVSNIADGTITVTLSITLNANFVVMINRNNIAISNVRQPIVNGKTTTTFTFRVHDETGAALDLASWGTTPMTFDFVVFGKLA